MKATRTDRHLINNRHPCYNTIKDYCIKSKNLYNYANYIIRQEFINNGKYLKYYHMQSELKTTEPYKELMSQASQCTLQVLDRNWRSFFVSIKDWKKNPQKYLGMPNLPKYKKKNGQFPWILKNNQGYITEEGRLHFKMKCFNGYEFPTNIKDKGRLISIRFIPKGCVYMMEIVYEIDVEEIKETNDNILSIDLGVNNFVTMVNNTGDKPIIINGKVIKSYNQYWNKNKAKIQSEIKKRNNINWCKRLDKLTLKRENKLNNYLHHTSRFIVNYCKYRNIDNIVIGINHEWKQRCKIKDRQGFIYIPYIKLINMIKYKAEEFQIRVIETNESYTSGTSFLDNELPVKDNYNKKRRIKRGLFKSNSGILINSDVNGAFQIGKKVFPNAFSDGIVGVLNPVVINLCK